MPIGSLERKKVNQTHRVGIIRMGYKDANRKNCPVETPYFVLTDAPDLIKFYGEKPTSITIVFTEDDPDLIASQYLQMYGSLTPGERDPSKRKDYLACKGMGIDPQTNEPTVAFYYDTKNIPPDVYKELPPDLRQRIQDELNQCEALLAGGNFLESKAQIESRRLGLQGILSGKCFARLCRHFDCPEFKKKQCKAVMTMNFKVPMGSAFGNYVLRSSSNIAMANVNACLQEVRSVVAKFMPDLPFGKISGIPMTLSRVRQQTQFIDAEGNKKFAEHYILKIEVDKTFAQKATDALREQIQLIMLDPPTRLMSPGSALALPGAIEMDSIIPDDLYVSPEEQEAQEEERRLQEERKQVLAKREEWIYDPAIAAAIEEYEVLSGTKMSQGLKTASARKYETKEAFLQTILEKVNGIRNRNREVAESPSVPTEAQG